MKKKGKLPKYEPPCARDLSSPIGYGGDVSPLGHCWTGSVPSTVTCFPLGSIPTQDDIACDPYGHSAELGRCLEGLKVSHSCFVGSMV